MPKERKYENECYNVTITKTPEGVFFYARKASGIGQKMNSNKNICRMVCTCRLFFTFKINNSAILPILHKAL